jgi:NAD-dependent SIR2 family protein deacetylase
MIRTIPRRFSISKRTFSTRERTDWTPEESEVIPTPASLQNLPSITIDAFKLAAIKIASSDAIIITAGAGMSIPSNLPSFRKPSTFQHYFPSLARTYNLNFMEAASLPFLEKHPDRAMGMWSKRWDLFHVSPFTLPHAGFSALKSMSNRRFPPWVITTNIDSQFERAGFDTTAIWKRNGSLRNWQCSSCSEITTPTAEEMPKYDPMTTLADLETIPECPSCKSFLRPNVDMWADTHFNDTLVKQQKTAFEAYLSKLSKEEANFAVVEVGAGTAVPEIRDISETLVRSSNGDGFLIRINSDPADATLPVGLDGVVLPLDVVQALQLLGQLLRESEKPTIVDDMIEDQLGI